MNEDNTTNNNPVMNDAASALADIQAEIPSTDSTSSPQASSGQVPPPTPVIPAPGPAPTPASAPELTIEQQLEAAKLAMEGPARTAKREEHEQKAQAETELAELNKRLADIREQKRAMEVTWVDLDNRRNELKKLVDPILAEEAKLEEGEARLEVEEKSAALPLQKHETESRRWETTSQRQEMEKQKWGYQEKMLKLEKELGDNTQKYQDLLDQEEEVLAKIDRLKALLV